MGKTYYIVWNETRTEGYITDDLEDAEYASSGKQAGWSAPTLGVAFREAYEGLEDDFELQEIKIELN